MEYRSIYKFSVEIILVVCISSFIKNRIYKIKSYNNIQGNVNPAPLIEQTPYKMMDIFYVFQYKLTSGQSSSQSRQNSLRYLKYTKINVNLTQTSQFNDQSNFSEFERLDEDITQSKVLLKKMLQKIIRDINQSMMNFVNVTLTCEDMRLFTEVIPKQCSKRQLAVPYVMMNFIDLRDTLKAEYYCPYKKWTDIVQFLQVCSSRQVQVKSSTQILQKVLKRLHRDGKLSSTHHRFGKRCEGMINQFIGQNQKIYKYFKVIGLPFKAFPSEILQILCPQVAQNRKELCFIYQRDRFSGRGVIKIPEDYEKTLVQKNRMYIGTRYIQLEVSGEQEFQKAKMKLQSRKSQHSPIKDRKQDERDSYNIGGRRRSGSRSPPSYSRSREKHSHRNQRAEHRVETNPFENDFNLNTGQSAIKVRGLPFAFSQWDVQNLFSFYGIVGGSVKLGIKPGTTLKNGQAVILMRNYSDAQKTLEMNGFRSMGRYLQVKVISKDQYLRYK